MLDKDKPIILAISAASGIIYGIKVLEFLLKNGYKAEVVFSSKAYYIAKHELDLELNHDKEKITDNLAVYLKLNKNQKQNMQIWLDNELWANCASGSHKTNGMIIAPCSMATVAAIASGLAETLITRAADVCLKEKRALTIVPRETPLNSIHLENMLKLSRAGTNIVVPSPGFYGKIKTLEDSIDFVVGKILDINNIENSLYERWL